MDGVEGTLGEKFKPMEEAKAAFDAWKPQVEAAVDDLKLEISVLRKHMDLVVVEKSSSSPRILLIPETAIVCPSVGDLIVSPHGHHEKNDYREPVFGSVTTLAHLLVKGRSG